MDDPNALAKQIQFYRKDPRFAHVDDATLAAWLVVYNKHYPNSQSLSKPTGQVTHSEPASEPLTSLTSEAISRLQSGGNVGLVFVDWLARRSAEEQAKMYEANVQIGKAQVELQRLELEALSIEFDKRNLYQKKLREHQVELMGHQQTLLTCQLALDRIAGERELVKAALARGWTLEDDRLIRVRQVELENEFRRVAFETNESIRKLRVEAQLDISKIDAQADADIRVNRAKVTDEIRAHEAKIKADTKAHIEKQELDHKLKQDEMDKEIDAALQHANLTEDVRELNFKKLQAKQYEYEVCTNPKQKKFLKLELDRLKQELFPNEPRRPRVETPSQHDAKGGDAPSEPRDNAR